MKFQFMTFHESCERFQKLVNKFSKSTFINRFIEFIPSRLHFYFTV